MPGIVRRQAAGGLGADPGQAVRMGLAATGSICALLAGRVAFGLCRRSVCTYAKRMRMAWHLRHAQGRAADSAGKTFLIAAMRHNQELFHASSYRSSR